VLFEKQVFVGREIALDEILLQHHEPAADVAVEAGGLLFEAGDHVVLETHFSKASLGWTAGR
jgi:hypothetical protein